MENRSRVLIDEKTHDRLAIWDTREYCRDAVEQAIQRDDWRIPKVRLTKPKRDPVKERAKSKAASKARKKKK